MERKIGEEIPEQEINKAESEVVRGYREISLVSFKNEKDVKIHIYNPNLEEQTKIADYYTDIYNGYLLSESKTPTKKQMLEILERKGIWGKKDEEQLDVIRKKMIQSEVETFDLQKRKAKIETIDAKRNEYKKHRDKLLELVGSREHYLAQTIESKAEDACTLLKMVMCIKYSDGKNVWNNIEELKKERSRDIFEIVSEATYFWNGLSKEVLQNLPGEFLQGEDLGQLQEQSSGSEDTQ